MDKESLSLLAKQIKTKEDFLSLLNYIKQNDMEANGMADKFYPFTMRHINYYCNPRHTYHRYKQFKIRKKKGGFRQITAPKNRSFMLILRYTNEILKSLYTPSDYAMGFCEGRSVVDNASLHKGHNYIFNIDLKDFFPSIEQARVWKRLQLEPFNFPVSIANLIAGLCSMKEIREIDGCKREYYVLPQGAPTSPIITNMICDNLDKKLAGLAKRFGLTYSRYADDITFSSMHNVYQDDSDFQKELRRIIMGQNLTINDDKTRLQKRGAHQEVTGLTISDKINVSQRYIRDIRNLLFIWKRWGMVVAESRFLPIYKENKGYLKKGNPNMVNVIGGKLQYLKMVRGEDDSVYQKLSGQFQQLVDNITQCSKVNQYGITYVETYTLIEFEKIIGQSVQFKHDKNSHRYAQFMLGKYGRVASIHKSVRIADEGQKDILSISFCKDREGNPFWLVHRSDKSTIFVNSSIDIDELNNDLDSLLML